MTSFGPASRTGIGRGALLSNRILYRSRSLLLCVAWICMARSAVGQLANPIPQPIPKGPFAIELTPVATGLSSPTYLTHAADGSNRLFIVDQVGEVRLLKDGALASQPFLDVKNRLVPLMPDVDERGLLGLAFHPGFADPQSPGFRRLYTYTSEPVTTAADFTTPVPLPPGVPMDHQSVIAEWQVDSANPDIVSPASRREIMRIDQPQFNHNAGTLLFGPDNSLYISIGDGGGADDQDGQPFMGVITQGHGPIGTGQNIGTILGKVARIDPLGTNSANGRYGVPAANPFVGTAGVDEIFAYGFRNPFRMSFDSTGRLIAGDVGQHSIEEVDIVTAGGNYGWRLKEGSFKFELNGTGPGFVTNDLSGLPAGLIDPVLQHDHDEGIAVIGGFVYEGSSIPELTGKYVFGDLARTHDAPTGRLFVGDLGTGDISELIIGTNDRPLGLLLKGFGEDASGELYVLGSTGLGPFGPGGTVLKMNIIPEPSTVAMVLAATILANLALVWRRFRR